MKIIRNIITRATALRMSIQILERAEQERIKFAEIEAKKQRIIERNKNE